MAYVSGRPQKDGGPVMMAVLTVCLFIVGAILGVCVGMRLLGRAALYGGSRTLQSDEGGAAALGGLILSGVIGGLIFAGWGFKFWIEAKRDEAETKARAERSKNRGITGR